jgi:hypothetical protein
MKITPQNPKKPNKRARDVRDESSQISKKPNKHVLDAYAKSNPYDHNPNGVKSDFYSGGWIHGGLND